MPRPRLRIALSGHSVTPPLSLQHGWLYLHSGSGHLNLPRKTVLIFCILFAVEACVDMICRWISLEDDIGYFEVCCRLVLLSRSDG
ncbi:unnamed protein product [Protopolystoma xenopodis]|uniref:Uncharacterized protein n=1 Tax=Protopolystoma xenopodis TaxID=117903 RepID=A0A3S5B2V2_9PLAT|nr:unnamed protein product [Protopolystoma xenopodis]